MGAAMQAAETTEFESLKGKAPKLVADQKGGTNVKPVVNLKAKNVKISDSIQGGTPAKPQFDPIKTPEQLLPKVDEGNPDMNPTFKVPVGPGKAPTLDLDGPIDPSRMSRMNKEGMDAVNQASKELGDAIGKADTELKPKGLHEEVSMDLGTVPPMPGTPQVTHRHMQRHLSHPSAAPRA